MATPDDTLDSRTSFKGGSAAEQASTVYFEAAGSSTVHAEPEAGSGSPALNAALLRERKHKRRYVIKKLEKKLELLDRQIKKYNEAEVSLEEMETGSSAYLKEDFYKRKFVQTWQKLCELQSVPDEIVIEDSANYAGTSYPEINRRVQRLLRLDEFPDYFDICQLVDRCNTKHGLGISTEEKSQLSRKIFKEVGKLLKDRRQRDFIAHFGSHLTDSCKTGEDPASVDLVLLDKLKASLREGQAKLEELCEGFVVKQEQECPEGGVTPEGDSCSLNEEEEEEEEQSESEAIAVEQGKMDIESEMTVLEKQLEDGRPIEAEFPKVDRAPRDLAFLDDIVVDTGVSPSSLCNDKAVPDSTIPSDSTVTSSQPHGTRTRPAESPEVRSVSGGSSSSLEVCELSGEEPQMPAPTSSCVISLSDSDSDEVVVISDDD